MSKVDKGTRAELRRLASLPGHDRIGLMAKGCISDLLDELEKLEAAPKNQVNASLPAKSFEDRPKAETGRWSSKKVTASEDADEGEDS